MRAEILRRGLEAPADLDARLSEVVQAARSPWASIAVADDDFLDYLAARWPEATPLEDWLQGGHLGDLYLACACARGAAGALEAFDRVHLAPVADYLARNQPGPTLVEEVRQALREKLFVGASRKIEEYSGRGALGGWVRVLSLRALIDLRRARGERLPDLGAEAPAALDPELQILSERYRGEVEEGFRRALTSLDSEQRLLLRMHFIDAVTLDELARLKKLHRATVARHLQAAREAVLTEVHRHLRDRFSLPAEELDSLVGLVRSQLDVSVARLLA